LVDLDTLVDELACCGDEAIDFGGHVAGAEAKDSWLAR